MNEKDDNEPENHTEPELNDKILLDKEFDEKFRNEELNSENFEEEEIQENIDEDLINKEKDSLSIEIKDENMNEYDTDIIGDDIVESQMPLKLTKEDLELQLKVLRRNLIEGALYAAGRTLDVEELSTKLEIPKKEVEELVKDVAFDYLDRSGALIIAQIGEKYQMQLRPELTEKVSKFAKGGAIAERYLRTLTIIALKQPILKSTVIKLRGSGAYEHIKYLLDNDLITDVKKGRSAELSTSDKYAEMFGLPKNKEELKRMMISQLGLGKNTD